MNVAATLLGAHLGTYEVQSLLGSGGMARVYRGFDHNLQRPVAVKVLTEAAAAEPGIAARFQQEARFIARLRHPHIVQVYDFGEANGLAYMVQELLPGPTLEQQIAGYAARNVPFSREETVVIARQLAAALDAAHAAGIIHRDVKPSNAMYNARGELVLTDFGIARLSQGQTAHTQTGLVIGTPDYLSPEQAQGLPPTTASDVYALGVLLYELIAGRRPFVATTPMGVVLGHIQEQPPSLQALRPDLPTTVEGVVMQALAKDPAARFVCAGDLAKALEQAWLSAPTASVHNVPTAVWSPATASAPGEGAITRVVPANEPTQINQARLAANPPGGHAPLVRARKFSPLPILGGLLLLLLLGGSVMALRGGGEQQEGANEPTSAPVAAVLPTSAIPTAAPSVVPTLETASVPTAAPTPPPEPPTAAPASSLDQLWALYRAAVADGQIENSEEIGKRLEEFESAVNAGDTKRASDQLRNLREKLGSEEIAPNVRQQADQLLDQIAATYGLGADSPTPGDNSDKDKGKGKGKGKD